MASWIGPVVAFLHTPYWENFQVAAQMIVFRCWGSDATGVDSYSREAIGFRVRLPIFLRVQPKMVIVFSI
jgi:hypothetical protein